MHPQYILGLLAVVICGVTTGRAVSNEAGEESNLVEPSDNEEENVNHDSDVEKEPTDAYTVPIYLQQHSEIGNLHKKIEEISVNTSVEFNTQYRTLENNRKKLESALTEKFQSIQALMNSEETQAMQKAKEEGKDVEKIDFCFKSQKEFNKNMTSNLKKTYTCINNATANAKDKVKRIKNAYTKKSPFNSKQGRAIIKNATSCTDPTINADCLQSEMLMMQQKVKETDNESIRELQKVIDVIESQKIETEVCRQRFQTNLETLCRKHNEIVNMCVTYPDKLKKLRDRK